MSLSLNQILVIFKQLEDLLEANGVPPPTPPTAPKTKAYLAQQLKGTPGPNWSAATFILFVGKLNAKFRTTLDPNKAGAAVTVQDTLQAIINQKEGTNPPDFWP